MFKFFEKRRFASLVMVFLLAIEIFYFSSLSSQPGTAGFAFIPIMYHFSVFFLINFFLILLITGEKPSSTLILLSVFISIIYAISDEIHQMFVPFRDASLSDVLTDTLGIFSSTAIYFLAKRKKKGKTQK
jgi:VanZ family protein